MPGRSYQHIRKLILSLLILSGVTVTLFSQGKKIGGIINVYRHVDSVGVDYVILNRVDSIAIGDTVLLIQMQGVGIVTDQDAYGQSIQTKYGEPGGYEFLLVESVDAGTKKVIFRNNVTIGYDTKGIVQLVRVPYYNSATVTSKLTSRSWDNAGKVGGVLAMIVGRKLKLNAAIDVSGKGFLGGKGASGIGECVMLNKTDNDHDSYPAGWLNAGYKGEGLAIHDQFGVLLAPDHVKGQGIDFTGGGGGNGKYSGGGGGANRGKGGDGASEKNLGDGSCADPQPGAYGGTTVKSTVILDGIFFGGGGGSSTYASGSTASSGGNGGGIVIIIADTISGNGNSIKANGATAGNAVNDAGAGGGGAGGSIILSLQSFSNDANDSLKIYVNGGNGGTNPGGFGNGGGGGGGLLWVSKTSVPGKVPVKINYGIPGPANSSQGLGEVKYSFTPELNGFLFNSIRSEITGDQVDSICSNVPFGKITGTKPLGGVAPYTFSWESSTTSGLSGFSAAAGTNNGQDYSPGLLTQTTWYRRRVVDNAGLSDMSKAVKIILQPKITGNLIGKDTTICYNQNPTSLIPLNSGPDNGNGYYEYKWLQSHAIAVWDTSQVAEGTIVNKPRYDPPALAATTYYKRYVTSGRCVDFSPIVTITVLPRITGNSIIRTDSVICEGGLFNDIQASAPGGGDLLNYSFQWQDSTVSSVWKPASGTNTNSGYTADTSTFSKTENRYLRRVVFSGPHNVCASKSVPILLTRYHKIKNNYILSKTPFCSETPSLPLLGSTPIQGKAGDYTYEWQDSSKISNWTTRGIYGPSFSPSELIDSKWYRRIVNSSKCADTSLSVVAYRIPTADAGRDTSVCGPTVVLNAVPSIGTGTWTSSSSMYSLIQSPNDPYTSVTVDSTLAGSSSTYSFFWKELNWQCASSDTVKITFDKRVNANPGRDTALYSFDNIIHMVANDPLPGTGIWTLISGSGNFASGEETNNKAVVTDLSKGLNTFLWTVTNGLCTTAHELNVTVYDIFVPEGFSPNYDEWNNTFTITGLDLPNQEAELTIINGAGAKVFVTSKKDGWTNWAGKNSKGIDLPEGTYYYLLKITSVMTGQVYKKSGFIILKRY